MATYFMFGKYSSEAAKKISGDRTKKVVNTIKKLGGKVNSAYALLGEHDLIFIVDFPKIDAVIKASIALNKLTGISFSTSPAVTVEHFDKIIAGK
tara:strand:- start:576 stop:860 length:285 start_codon:yes stop_codon:yes gene_type:complete